ncbi:conserved protein, unknown function, partial [Hepatocystis sp. ex Piliocolobus tephrosceles]
VTEVGEAAEVTEVGEAAEVTEVGEAAEVTEVGEAAEVTEVGEAAEVTEVGEAAEVTEVGEAAEVTEVGEAAEVTEVREAAEVTKVGEAAEVTEVGEVAEVTEVGEVAEVGEKNKETKQTCISEAKTNMVLPNESYRLLKNSYEHLNNDYTRGYDQHTCYFKNEKIINLINNMNEKENKQLTTSGDVYLNKKELQKSKINVIEDYDHPLNNSDIIMSNLCSNGKLFTSPDINTTQVEMSIYFKIYKSILMKNVTRLSVYLENKLLKTIFITEYPQTFPIIIQPKTKITNEKKFIKIQNKLLHIKDNNLLYFVFFNNGKEIGFSYVSIKDLLKLGVEGGMFMIVHDYNKEDILNKKKNKDVVLPSQIIPYNNQDIDILKSKIFMNYKISAPKFLINSILLCDIITPKQKVKRLEDMIRQLYSFIHEFGYSKININDKNINVKTRLKYYSNNNKSINHKFNTNSHNSFSINKNMKTNIRFKKNESKKKNNKNISLCTNEIKNELNIVFDESEKEENVGDKVDVELDEQIDEKMYEKMDENMDEKMDENMDEHIDQKMYEKIYEKMDENMDENMDEHIDQKMDAKVDENIDVHIYELVHEKIEKSCNNLSERKKLIIHHNDTHYDDGSNYDYINDENNINK